MGIKKKAVNFPCCNLLLAKQLVPNMNSSSVLIYDITGQNIHIV